MKNLICPVSSETINENTVRITALWVVLLTALFIAVPNPFVPLYLIFDFYIRAFTKSRYSPLSWISAGISRSLQLSPKMIDKAPKVFAGRVGLLFSFAMLLLFLLGAQVAALSAASVLILFAFLECGLNFCAGCWVYTYVVIPLYRDK